MKIKSRTRCIRHRGWRLAAMIVLGILGVAAFALLFGLAVQYLWNWLMPDLFGLKTITYLQAFAIVILAKILFGGFGMGHGHSRKKDDPCRDRSRDARLPDEAANRREDFDGYWASEGRAAFERYLEEKGRAKKDEGAGE